MFDRSLLAATALAACSGGDGETPTGDTGEEAPFAVFQAFDAAAYELPEGLAVRDGDAFVSFAGLGRVDRIPLSGDPPSPFAEVPPLTPDTSFITGISFDEAGQLYISQPSFTAEPVAGVYRAPADGGAAALFASGPQIVFPSDAEPDSGGRLYITDSATGTVQRADPSGVVEVWASDPLLVGDRTVCGNDAAAFDVGANGLVVTGDALFVANTDRATIVRIPVASDGTAGAPEVYAGPDCDALGGIDGIVQDDDGSFYAALNRQDRVVRVAVDGTVTIVTDDEALDFPSAVRITAIDGRKALLITSFAYANAISGGDARPNLGRYWLE